MKQNILFLLSLCMLLLTCSDGNDPIKEIENKDPFITLKKSNIDFTNDGGSEAILIESNVTWTAKSSVSWCTVSPSSGNKSTASITLSAPANEDYDNRSCTVTIESGGISKTITVNQGENLGLLITQDRYELSNEESTIKVEVKANVDFEVEINDKWITRVDTRGLTTSQIEFKIAENDTYGNREGSITIKQKGGGMTSTITVYQSQENAIILSEKEVEVSDRSQTLDVVIKTNIDFDVTIQEDGKDWVSYTPTRGLREETISLNISENKTDRTRSTEVYIKDKLTSLQETLTITQIGKEPGVYYVDRMGTLGSMLSQTQKDTITTMIVKGEINKADFDVMKKQMPKLKYIDLKDVKCEGDKIPDYAFGRQVYGDENIKITTIILPESITAIGESAFRGCTGLTGNLILPDGVTTIGYSAFSGCSGLTGDLIIPDGVTIIEGSTFDGCTGFTGNLIIPDGVTTIGYSAFSGCSGFTGNLILPDGLTEIGEKAFWGCSGFTGNLILPDGLTEIGRWAFCWCSGFRGDLIIPNGVTTIGESTFFGCSGLTGNLILPDGLTTMGGAAFRGCSGLTGNLILPDGLTTIETEAFFGCSGLTGLTIGKNLITIDKSAFYNCRNITGNVVFPASLASIRNYAFNYCNKVDIFQFPHTTPLGYYPGMLPDGATIKVPTSAVATYKAANGWKDYNIVGY